MSRVWLPIDFFLLGFIFCWIFAILFQRNDKKWQDLFYRATGITFFGLPAIFLSLLKVNSEQCMFAYGLYFIGSVVAFILVIFFANRSLKDKKFDKEKIGLIDIILGHSNIFRDYYERTTSVEKREIDIHSHQEANNIKESFLTEKEKSLNDIEQLLISQKHTLEETLKKGICLHLPVNQHYPVSNPFIIALPEYVNNIFKFSMMCKTLNDEFINKLSETGNTDFDCLQAYLTGICIALSVALNNSNNRIHFRYLHNNQYVKLAASLGQSKYNEPLTPIHTDETSLIKSAAETKRSIIYSLNSEKAFTKTQNNHIWEDYITMAFEDYCNKDAVPLLTMGISCKFGSVPTELLTFLNHIRFEQLMKDILKTFNECYNIKKILILAGEFDGQTC